MSKKKSHKWSETSIKVAVLYVLDNCRLGKNQNEPVYKAATDLVNELFVTEDNPPIKVDSIKINFKKAVSFYKGNENQLDKTTSKVFHEVLTSRNIAPKRFVALFK